MLSRRTFLATLAGGLLAAPLTAEGQHAGRVYRIGVFHVGDHIPPGLQTLRGGLGALGYREGKNIQIDFLESDPVATGFVRNLAQPGGNITGVFLDLPDLSGKQLQLLKEIIRPLPRVAILGDPALRT